MVYGLRPEKLAALQGGEIRKFTRLRDLQLREGKTGDRECRWWTIQRLNKFIIKSFSF